jgi:hypothetical protein
MTSTFSYENALDEFYRAEVIGEAIMSALIDATDNPLERLKLAHLLQLETETKAWLRLHMIRAGLSVAEPPEFREPPKEIASSMALLDWPEMMKAIIGFIPELVKQYGAYADAARSRGEAEQAAVCDFMIAHERSQEEFAFLELEGAEPETSLAPLIRQSRYPLPFGT